MCSIDLQTARIQDQINFLSFLKENSREKVRIYSVVGFTGEGKSTFLNFLLRSFLRPQTSDGKAPYIFKSSSRSDVCTIGVDYYQVLKEGIYYIFLDCQGMDGMNYQINNLSLTQQNNYEGQVRQLQSLICKISTSIFIITSSRISKGLVIVIENAISDCDRKFEDFIIIQMKKEKITTLSITEQKFINVLCFPFLKCKQNENNTDQSFEFNQQVQDLFNGLVNDFILNKAYKKPNNQLCQFQKEQTCEIVFQYLKSAYLLLNKEFGEIKSYKLNHFKIIDSLNQVQFELDDKISNLENNFKDKISLLNKINQEKFSQRKNIPHFANDFIVQFFYVQFCIEQKQLYERYQLDWLCKLNTIVVQDFYYTDYTKKQIEQYFQIKENFKPRKVNEILINEQEKNKSFGQKYQDIPLKCKVKEQKKLIRQKIFDKQSSSSQLTFQNLEQIIREQLPSIFEKIQYMNDFQKNCATLFSVFSCTQRTFTKINYKAYTHKVSIDLFQDAQSIYDKIIQQNQQFKINFQYIFGKKNKLNQNDLDSDLNQHLKLQELLQKVEQEINKEDQQVIKLYKKLITLRNINVFFLIRMLINFYFKDFLVREDVKRFYSDGDNIINLTEISFCDL